MKNIALLAIVSIFAFSIVLGGCGKVSKEDFEAAMNESNTANAAEHSRLGNEVSELGGKVDEQGNSLRSEVSTAKESAIASAEQGDADTIKTAQQFAQDEDTKLRDELTKTANMAGEKAQAFAKDEDDKLREDIKKLSMGTKDHASTLTKLQASLADAKEETKMVKAASAKSRLIATVHFTSGRSGLTQEAKQELDKAITAIEDQSDAMVKVKGHADGRPVLSGRYRSNWDLSQARADAVAKYLKEKGVTNKIETRALGHTEPMGTVSTKAGRSMNRRVEVILVPASEMM